MIKTCELANGNYNKINFAGSPSIREFLCQRETIAGTGRFVLDQDKILNRSFYSSNNISGDDLWCGDFGTVLLIRFFGGMEISVNPFMEDKEGLINLFIRMYCNLVIRNGAVIIRGTSFS